MKKLKYFIIFLLSVTIFTSCFKDDSDLDLNDKGNNVIGFTNARENVAAIADGNVYTFPLKIKVTGPTSMDISNDVTVTFAATDASTAIEGVHYSLTNATATLTKADNYLGFFNLTMLTDGIEAPLAVSPKLFLQATVASGDDKVVASGKPVEITLNYACFSDLAGTYTETAEYWRAGVFQSAINRTVVFTETGTGEYRTSVVGHWTAAALGGTPGFTFYDVCDAITIPGQNLVNLYSNWVQGVAGASYVDEVTGNIYMEYTIVVPPATSDRLYKATYVKQ